MDYSTLMHSYDRMGIEWEVGGHFTASFLKELSEAVTGDLDVSTNIQAEDNILDSNSD